MYSGKRREHKTVTIGKFVEHARLARAARRSAPRRSSASLRRARWESASAPALAKHLDVIHPMVYPSHFGAGEYSLDDPNAVPGVTVARALRDPRRDLRGRDTLLVPWLQDSSLGRDYTLEDVRAQILAARDAQSAGFLPREPERRLQDGRPA